MVMTTRQQKFTAAFEHITKNILEAKDGDPLTYFMNTFGFANPIQINSTSPEDIRTHEFKMGSNATTKVSLSKVDCGTMRALQGYIEYRAALLDPIGENDWTKITLVQFDAFRASNYCDPSEPKGLKKGTKEEVATMATTRENQHRQQKHTAAFVHIIENLLEEQGQPIESFIKSYGFTNPMELDSTSLIYIRVFEFPDASGVNKKLSPLDCGNIRTFQGYIKYRAAQLDPIEEDDWTSITLAQFDAFRVSDYDPSEPMGLTRGTTEELATIADNSSTP
jgi:isopentenyldiphosphate isomerase